jgi:hypothetical protein
MADLLFIMILRDSILSLPLMLTVFASDVLHKKKRRGLAREKTSVSHGPPDGGNTPIIEGKSLSRPSRDKRPLMNQSHNAPCFTKCQIDKVKRFK